MTKDELVLKVKLRVRKMSADKLDEDVGQLVGVALADLSRVGVHESYLKDIENPLLVEAILLYASANFGSPENRDALMASYDMMLMKIKGGGFHRSKDSETD
ncbi:MAG: hypothetical protein HFG98_05865 [Dorea sp.]|nr:hypothetical protein [Dorea sp.]